MAKLTKKQIIKLIYPVSFYRHKAAHVKQTCRILVERFNGRVPATMEELLTLPGRRPQDGKPGADPVVQEPDEHLRRHPRAPDFEPARLGARPGRRRKLSRRSTRARPDRWWPYLNLYLVTWGQNVCRPIYPRCGAA